MKFFRLLLPLCALAALLLTTGCFRVGSETAGLRDAVLDSGFGRADEKIEFGAGFFTVGVARLASKYVEMPPEARTAIGSLKEAECAVYDVRQPRGSLSSILMEADRVMEARGCERLVGLIQHNQLVAVYVPSDMDSTRDIKASVLVLDRHQLVCVTARANARDLIQLAMSKIRESRPAVSDQPTL